MAFDLKTWKAMVSKCLRQWRSEMQQAGVSSEYAYLAAMTLWPVVEAARAGDWGAPATLGSVGGTALVIRVQHWQNAIEGAHQLAAAMATEPLLRSELDAVLTAIGTAQLAAKSLPAAERQWLADALQLDHQPRRGSRRVQAHNKGAGSIAQGPGAVAAGAGGAAIAGDVHGNVYIGRPTRDVAKALAIYCRLLIAGCHHLPLHGLDVGASDPNRRQKPLNLAHVYVHLNTTAHLPTDGDSRQRRRARTSPEEHDPQPLSALQAVITHRCLVLLGNPGSGKSTFLNHLALCLAQHRVDRQGKWLSRLSGWPRGEANLVPVIVILRDFVRWLPPEVTRPEPQHLWYFIESRLKGQKLEFAIDPLHELFDRDQAILLLDGLDEVPTAAQRAMVRHLVSQWTRRYANCRLIVTCRTLSYQNPAWQLDDVPAFELAPFDEAQIRQFITAWYEELTDLELRPADESQRLAQRLSEAIERPDLRPLAPNPLLLTVMALVHTHKNELPDARTELYEDAVKILLWQWEQQKAEGNALPLRQLLAQVQRGEVDLRQVLAQLAFEAHQQSRPDDHGEVADIGELRLGEALRALHPGKSRDWAFGVVEAIKERAGLLIERMPGVYTFPHRTFQEYLAADHLSSQPDFAGQAWRLVTEGPFWREVLLLAVGQLIYLNKGRDKALSLIDNLCRHVVNDTPTGWWQAWLAGDALLEMGVIRARDDPHGQALAELVPKRLVELLHGGHLSPVERAAAGNTLARLGDVRFRADAWYLPKEPLLGFVDIPAGLFLMGSDKRRDPEAYADELPQHEVILPRYFIGCYPVTVAQFRAFVEATGNQPGDADCLRGLPNHPVVWISWDEARQYCDWLTVRLRDWPDTPEPLASLLRQHGWVVTLPSEVEWEKAARGTDGRLYPWGDEPDPTRANYGATGIDETSAVGCFPGGASPYGIEDLSGNVWEWTRSLWGDDWRRPAFTYPYDPADGREALDAATDTYRVLRGGAFGFGRGVVRCACRGGHPGGRGRRIGFRVVGRPCL